MKAITLEAAIFLFFYSCGPKSISLFLLLFWEFVVLSIVRAFNTQSTVIIVFNY